MKLEKLDPNVFIGCPVIKSRLLHLTDVPWLEIAVISFPVVLTLNIYMYHSVDPKHLHVTTD